MRVALVIGLPSGGSEAYEALHRDVWPSVLERVRKSNITNYSIYRHGEMLFSYFEYIGDDYQADMAAMAADSSTQLWWDLCMPLQRPEPDRIEGDWWKPISEVFHLD